MGQSSSSDRRRRQSYPQTQPHHYPPPPPPTYPYAPNPSYYSNPYPMPPHQYNYNYNNPNSITNQLTMGYNSLLRFLDSLMGRTQYPSPHYPSHYYGPNQGSGLWVPPPPAPPPSTSSGVNTPQLVPQYVEHETARTVKNDVNIHKDTIRLEVDEQNPDQYLVSFVFDAVVDGSVTVYYFAKEGAKCTFSPVFAELYTPTNSLLQKGFGQKFIQPSGSGIDLGFFELDHLSKPMKGDVFPLVIYAQGATCTQITQAIIERKDKNGSFLPKVIKQILWTNGERYELQEIFGIEASADASAESSDANEDDTGKECVICLSEPRNTAVMPCRHMCMCSECAKAFRLQSSKCPICRQPVEQLMEIKVNRDEH